MGDPFPYVFESRNPDHDIDDGLCPESRYRCAAYMLDGGWFVAKNVRERLILPPESCGPIRVVGYDEDVFHHAALCAARGGPASYGIDDPLEECEYGLPVKWERAFTSAYGQSLRDHGLGGPLIESPLACGRFRYE